MAIFIFPQSAFAAGPWKGFALTTVTSGISTVTARASTDNSALPDSTTAGDKTSTWQLDAGSSKTVYYGWTESSTGAAPTTIFLDIYYENDTATVITACSQATPTVNTWYTCTFTPTKAGTFRLRVAVEKTSVVTYAQTTSDTIGDKGAVRSGMRVTAITRNAYPAGTNYAYGTASDENMTFTVASDDRQADTNLEKVRANVRKNSDSSLIDQGTTQELGTSGSTVQSFVADQQGATAAYTNGLDTYVPEVEITDNSALMTNEKWTHIANAGNGGTITRVSDTVARQQTTFSVDPTISFSTDGTTANNNVTTDFSLYNRGETVNWQFYLLNSRAEKLSRAMNVSVIASDTSTEDGPTSRTPTANLYSASYAIGSTHLATNDTTGSAKKFRATNTDQTKDSNNAHSVSSLIRLGSAQNGTNGNVNTTYSVYNRGETVSGLNFYLTNARGTAYAGKTSTIAVRDDVSTVENSQSLASDGTTGQVTLSYTVGATDKATADITGSPKHIRVTPPDGNTAFSSNNAHSVSSLYFVDAHPELDATLNADDWPTEDANETFTGIIAADLFSFFAHVKNVRKDTNIDTSGSAVTFTVKKPDGTTSATQTSDTASNGWTSNYDFSPVAPAGSWSVVANTTFNGNSGTDTETLTFVSPYSGNYQLEAVGWNQTYDIGDTARFTIRTLSRTSGSFTATAADSAPTYELRYWDGATWQSLASGSMTALNATGTYEITYAIPSDSAWIGRKVAVSFSAVMSGTRINETREIEIVGSPAQVVINSITDTTIPTISASVRITNEGTAAFEYTYEYCVVTADTNQCGGGDDVAYGSAAKLIQAGANFDTTLTLNVTQTGNYIFKVAVWWSNQSSKSSKTFTATSESVATPTPTPSGGGGGGGGTVTPTPQPAEQNTFAAVWQKITEIFARLLGIENRVGSLEARVATLERQLSQRAPVPVPRREISVPTAPRQVPKVETPAKPFFKIRLQ